MSIVLSWQKSQKVDPVKAVPRWYYVLHEFCCFFRRYFRNRSDFNPLGEFVDGHKDKPIATWGLSERPHGVEAPHGEGP
jgi:hypothetical protein